MSKKTEDSKLNKRKGQRIVTKQVDAAAAMTVADRLTRRARIDTVSITMEDDLGEFIVQIHQPTRGEMDELLKHQNATTDPDTKVQEEASQAIYKLLGNLCLDESLNFEYWNAGAYDLSDLVDIINTLFSKIVKKVKAIQQTQHFRQDGPRTGAVPDVRILGEIAT